MDEFINLIQNESISTIEGLTGYAPDITFASTSQIKVKLPYIKIIIENNAKSKILFIAPSLIATILANLMFKGNTNTLSTSVSNDDLEAIKEIVYNVFGAVSTTLKGQKKLPVMDFAIAKAEILKENESFDGFYKAYEFKINLKKFQSSFFILLSKNIINELNNQQPKPKQIQNVAHTSTLDKKEIKNIEMLLDIKMLVRVRIGQKKMLLKDVINIDIGSVVELNQLANEPLEILVDDKVIAKGEVVVIDGNFGVQITEINTHKERLEQLK